MIEDSLELIKPDIVIFHCAATPDFPYGSNNYDKFGLKEIDTWHKQRGFLGCGYHFIIRRSGEIEVGREIDHFKKMVEIGAHCKGENHRSIGVCYVGTKEMTKPQQLAVMLLFRAIKKEFDINAEHWHGHYEFNSHKTCPGFKIESLREILRQA